MPKSLRRKSVTNSDYSSCPDQLSNEEEWECNLKRGWKIQ